MRAREPGDDDDEVYERDEDGAELWPVWRVLQSLRLAGLTRTKRATMPRANGERTILVAHRDACVAIEYVLAKAEERADRYLDEARKDYRELARAGLASEADADEGRWLRDHVNEIRAARVRLREDVAALHTRLAILLKEK